MGCLIAAAGTYAQIADEKHPRWWILYALVSGAAALAATGFLMYFGWPRGFVRLPTRNRIGLWLDQRLGKTTPITDRQQTYLNALAEERRGNVQRRHRRGIRDVDAEIRKVWRDGSWLDLQGGAVPDPTEQVAHRRAAETAGSHAAAMLDEDAPTSEPMVFAAIRTLLGIRRRS